MRARYTFITRSKLFIGSPALIQERNGHTDLTDDQYSANWIPDTAGGNARCFLQTLAQMRLKYL